MSQRHHRLLIAVAFVGLAGCGAEAALPTSSDTTALAPTLTDLLRGGGYTIFWRHASATVCADDLALGPAATTTSPGWWKSCDATCPPGGPVTATARQLDATGVMEAKAVGNAMKARGIPVGRVQSSEFCRAVQTAENMAFPPAIETSRDLTYFVYDEAHRCARSMALLAIAPPAGTNAALISHGGFTCPVLDALASAEGAIYKPDGMGGATFIARVRASEWATLP